MLTNVLLNKLNGMFINITGKIFTPLQKSRNKKTQKVIRIVKQNKFEKLDMIFSSLIVFTVTAIKNCFYRVNKKIQKPEAFTISLPTTKIMHQLMDSITSRNVLS